MPWKRLLGPLDRLPSTELQTWYADLLAHADGLAPIGLAMLGGRLADTPGLAFLAGYQAALRALWPAAPLSLGAFCVTERRSLRPADLSTRLDHGRLQGCKDFVTAGTLADWYLVAARSEPAGKAPRLTLCRVNSKVDGARLEELPALPMLVDIPHARLHLTNAVAEVLPGDGWDDYVKPFRSIEDLHVLMALTAWLYGVGLNCGWPRELQLRLAGLLTAGAELARHDAKDPVTHVLLAGLFAQNDGLEAELEAALATTPQPWIGLWRRDRSLLKLAAAARGKRLDKALEELGLAF